MRRIGQWMLNALTVLLLVMCLATVVLWGLGYEHPLQRDFPFRGQQCRFLAGGGTWTIGNMPQVAMEKKRDAQVSNDLQARIDGLRASIGVYEKDGTVEDPSAKSDLLLKKSRLAVIQNKLAAIKAAQSSPGTFTVRIGMLAGVLGLVVMLMLAGQWRIRRAKSDASLCRACSYDLTGNVSGVCPECGKAVANR